MLILSQALLIQEHCKAQPCLSTSAQIQQKNSYVLIGFRSVEHSIRVTGKRAITKVTYQNMLDTLLFYLSVGYNSD